MSKKPGGAGGRGRTVALVKPSCPVCEDRRAVRLVMYVGQPGLRDMIKCPHCQSHVPIHTYYGGQER